MVPRTRCTKRGGRSRFSAPVPIGTPYGTREIEQRDRALIGFTLLSGARDRAIISFKLKHIDVENELIEVRTKRAKTFTTWFFPVGDDLRNTFVDWVAFLREQKGFGPEDPLFPKSKVAPDDNLEFRAVGLDRAHWANANQVRAIFRGSLRACGLALFQSAFVAEHACPIGLRMKLDAEQFKAWSQNLGHENCLTTFSSYGEIQPSRQAEIIRGLAGSRQTSDLSAQAEMLRKLADQMQRQGIPTGTGSQR